MKRARGPWKHYEIVVRFRFGATSHRNAQAMARSVRELLAWFLGVGPRNKPWFRVELRRDEADS